MSENKNECDCGCNEPFATGPIEALKFLASRFEFAGVAKAVGDSYAKDIRKILANNESIAHKQNDAMNVVMSLINAKEYKDKFGKDERYESLRKAAWEKAYNLLDRSET